MIYNTNVNVRAAVEVFSFLGDIFEQKNIYKVAIVEADAGILLKREEKNCGYYLLDEKGAILARLPDTSGLRWWNPLSWYRYLMRDDTIGGAFARIGVRAELVSQVLCYWGDPGRVHMNLYRVPKTYTILSWLEELEDRRRGEVEAARKLFERQIETIDAKGNNPKLLTDGKE